MARGADSGLIEGHADVRRTGRARPLVAAMTAATLGAAVVAPAASAQDSFDIGRYKDAGCTVDILLVDGERDQNGLLDKEAEIEAATGIAINVTALALGDEVAAVAQTIAADESPYDIVDVLGFFEAGSVGTGKFELLDDYVSDSSRTPADYDFEDFPPGVLAYQGYFDVETGQFGGDDLYLIPGIHSGSAILFYRKDLLEAAGLEVPKTWGEYLEAAKALTSGDVAGSAMIGSAGDPSTFLVDWYTRFITMGGQMVSGSKDDGTLRINLDGPEGVAALQNMIDLVPYSPVGGASFTLTDATNQFQVGKVAMLPTWSTIAGTLYAPDSPVADTVAVAPMPADDGNPRSIRGGWGLGIPANQSQQAKDCAWHILTQITSKEFEKHQVLNYQTDPNRSSTAEDPEIVAALPYIPEAVRALETAQFLEFVDLPETFEIAGEISREINLALTGSKDAATAMKDAQATVDGILQREGYQIAS